MRIPLKKDNMVTYESAGVSLDASDTALKTIKSMVKSTRRSEVLSGIGGFGALFELGNYDAPVLVSSIDGVGTKLKIAFMTGRHKSVAYDLVAHSGNDIAVQGAEPLFFLDYIGTGKLRQKVLEDLMEGFVEGCLEIGAALIGGETAEMPDFYAANEYELVGTIVGVVERSKVITGEKITPGDRLIGLPSLGLHTNGFSLARKVLFDRCSFSIDEESSELGTTIGSELLKNHKSYVKTILKLSKKYELKGMAHITGGGLPGNVVRILPDNCRAKIEKGSWEILPIFSFLQDAGKISSDEMFRVFNMGIGMVVVLSPSEVDEAIEFLKNSGEFPFQIGKVVKAPKGVEIV